jgi:hypothetical protein
MSFNLNEVVADGVRDWQKGNSRNRVAVGNVCWTMTQGSLAGSATLGFGTESRWDSGWLRAGCAGTPCCRGDFFSTNFFIGAKLDR